MLAKLYANRVNKEEGIKHLENENVKPYWFRNEEHKLVCVISYGTLLNENWGTLSFEDNIVLLNANNHKWISHLDMIIPLHQIDYKKVIYYVCD